MLSTLSYGLRLTAARLTGRSPFSETVLLAGSARSGTTWVGNVINHRNDYRLLFEPVHHERVPEFAAFTNRQYLRERDARPEYLAPLKRLLDGRITSRWVNAQNRNAVAHRLLVKEIRANLLLKWIAQHHPDIKIVLLLRHPCAVATSRLKLRWAPFPEAFLAQPDLMGDLLEPFRDLLEHPGSELLGNVACWCVENYVPIKQFGPGQIHVCYYENFVLDPQAEVARLMRFLGQPMPPDLGGILAKPSHTNWNRGDGSSAPLDQWKNEIDPQQCERAKSILERFGMDHWFDDSGRPLTPTLR